MKRDNPNDFEMREILRRLAALESASPLESSSVSNGRVRFIGGLLRIDSGGRVEIVGTLQIFVAPAYGALSDHIGRRKVYIAGCIGFALMVWPTFLLYGTHNPWLIWLGMILGFVIPGVAMQGTLQTMLTEMFDVEQRTTGVNIGYQLSNTFGGGLAPLIATALVGWAGGSIWPVVVYVAVICIIGAIATATAQIRPDTEDAGRLNALQEA